MPLSEDDLRWSTHKVDGDRCRQMADHIRRLGPILGRYTQRDEDWAGLAGSQAMNEALGARREGGQPLEIAVRAPYSMMHIGMFASFLHLKAIAALLELEDPLAESIMILSRSVLETSVRVWWLADPALSITQRIARGYLEKLFSAREGSLFQKSSPTAAVAGPITETTDSLIAEMRSLAIDFEQDDRGRFVVHDERRPQATPLIATFPGPDIANSHERFFRLFSASAHGTLYGLMLLFEGPPPDDSGKRAATYRVTQAWLDGPTSTAVLAFCWTVQRIAGLLDWDRQPLDSYMSELDDLYGELIEVT